MHTLSGARIHPFQEYGAHGTGAFCLLDHFIAASLNIILTSQIYFPVFSFRVFLGTYIFIEVFPMLEIQSSEAKTFFMIPKRFRFGYGIDIQPLKGSSEILATDPCTRPQNGQRLRRPQGRGSSRLQGRRFRPRVCPPFPSVCALYLSSREFFECMHRFTYPYPRCRVIHN